MRKPGLTALLCLVCLMVATGSARAGKYNEVLSIGDKAPAWENLPGADGKKHSLAELNNKKVVVVVFTCLSCPTATDYEDRIQAFAKQHGGGGEDSVGVVAICVNTIAADKLPKIEARSKKKEFVFQYLSDESQKIAKDYGALTTPEFFVLNQERKVAYMGAMDDATDAGKVLERYVEAAVEALLKGQQPAVTETAPRGCRVRYARERRK